MMIGIVAVAKNLAIGKDGKLPWHYSSDLKFFKRMTSGNAVVMGINTWRSIGKPLPNRLNIVLSRSADIPPESGVILLRSRGQLLALAEYLKCDVFIIGGAGTYRSFADAIEKWIVTDIPETVEDADVFMSEDFLHGYELEDELELEEGLRVRFLRKAK